jgi:hypothetical protein
MKLATIDAFGSFVMFTVAGWRQVSRATAMVAVMMGLAGCATGPMGGLSSPEAKVAAVTKRAQERWNVLLKGDVKAAYAYLSPASRAVTSFERYQMRTNPANFRSVRLEKVSCEAETCQLRFWLTFDHRMMKGVETPLEETWIIENGQAWYVYRE